MTQRRLSIPGIEKYPDLQRQLTHEENILNRTETCGDCDAWKQLKNKYVQLVSQRAPLRSKLKPKG